MLEQVGIELRLLRTVVEDWQDGRGLSFKVVELLTPGFGLLLCRATVHLQQTFLAAFSLL